MAGELQNELYEAYRTRDRGRLIAAIRKMLDLFQAIDVDKIRGILESIDIDRIVELITLVGGLFGGSQRAVTASKPALDLHQCVAEAKAQQGSVSAQAINIAAIVAIIRLILSIVGRLRGEETEV